MVIYMKKSTLSLIIASVVFSSNTMAVQDPNKYTQDQHHILLDIGQLESRQDATDYKINNMNIDVEKANQNSAEALDKANNLEGRVNTNETNISKLQETKADKSELTNLENKGNNAVVDINNRIDNVASVTDDFDKRINQNKSDISDQQKTISKHGERLTLVEQRADNNAFYVQKHTTQIAELYETKADKAELDEQIERGENTYTELNGKVENITNISSSAIGGAIRIGDYIKNNGDSIKTNIEGKIGTVIDNSVTNLVNNEGSKINVAVNGAKDTANDFDARITKNTTDIASQGGRLNAVEVETQRLEADKADKADLTSLEQKGNEAYNTINNKVESVSSDVEIINNKINKVEGVAGSIVANKDIIVNKAGDIYEGVRTDITNEINSNVNAAIGGIKGTANNTWENNKGDVKANVSGKYDGAKTEITNNVLNEIGDIAIGDSETIVNIKNDISKDVTNQLKLDAKDLAINIKKDIVEGNNEYVNQIKGEVSNQVNIAKDAAETVVKDFQEQIDATNANVDGQVKRGETAYANLKQQSDDNSQAIINISGKVDGAIEDGTYWVTNLQKQIDVNVEAGKTELTNINGKVDNAIQIGGDKITNLEQQIVEGNTTIIADVDAKLEDNSKKLIAMGQNESNRLEQDLRNDGQEAYDNLLARIDNATSKEDVDAILNEYKKQALANIRATVAKNGPAVVDGLQQAKDDAKQKAEDYVKNEIDQAIADNTQAGKDYVKDQIDNAVAGMTLSANDLDGRIEKLENTVNKGQVIVNNVKDAGKTAGTGVINKAPVVKGEVITKANTAINAGRTINDKANEALAIGANNTVAINQERTDRIQGQRETLKTSMAYTDSRFNSMQNQVDANRKRAAGGISGVSAMTNIPQLSGSATYSFGVGIGGFDGEQSIAAGGSARIKDNVVIRSSVSTSTEGEMVWGAGVGFEW